MRATVPQQSKEPPPDIRAVSEALAAPFEKEDVKFKPGKVSGTRALALAYVDARAIQDRLDEALGVLGWQDNYKVLPDGSVMCRLRIRLGDQWITKVDVGGQSEQPDGGDRTKAAFSDALKRAAVKFGIGRYLYRLPQQWVDYDPQKRCFKQLPKFPDWALPKKKDEPAVKGPTVEKTDPKTPPARPKLAAHTAPSNGAELQRRLYDYDAKLAKSGRCQPGELVKHIVAVGVKAGYDSNLESWTGDAIQLAIEESKRFDTSHRLAAAPKKDVA
jgi:hypothetical protein